MSEMDKPTPPHVAADTPIGPDVDLAADEVITPDGDGLVLAVGMVADGAAGAEHPASMGGAG